MEQSPVLYSFRRCPYAMRARMALSYSFAALDQKVELREIVLRDKPAEMLAVSPKGTVPVLVLESGEVIDESRDIINWALSQADPDGWRASPTALIEDAKALIDLNDTVFKENLDRYKYADRYTLPADTGAESSDQGAESGVDDSKEVARYYRSQGEQFLLQLNARLEQSAYLQNDRIGVADVAIFPFVRQFAHVDRDWFYDTPYRQLQDWLDGFLQWDLFLTVMKKFKSWSAGDRVVYLPLN